MSKVSAIKMKAMTRERSTSTYPGIASYGSPRIARHRRDVENEEIQAYLSRLKELVPFMPKNRRLTKLEVIQYVIDYIGDLEYALETHPSIDSAAVHSAATVVICSSSQQSATSPQMVAQLQHRQPLANVAVNSCISNLDTSPVSSSRHSEKVSSSTDS